MAEIQENAHFERVPGESDVKVYTKLQDENSEFIGGNGSMSRTNLSAGGSGPNLAAANS